jgi:hypothetical protein
MTGTSHSPLPSTSILGPPFLLGLSPTFRPITLLSTSSGVPSSGHNSQHRRMISWPRVSSQVPDQLLSSREPPRMTPPPRGRGKMYVVVGFMRAEERRYLLQRQPVFRRAYICKPGTAGKEGEVEDMRWHAHTSLRTHTFSQSAHLAQQQASSGRA